MFSASKRMRSSSHHFRNVLSLCTSTSLPKQKIVIVGGVAGGATAAARASRLSNHLDITVIERSPDVSFANCGLPYYIGGEITDRSKLALMTPKSLSESLRIKVLTNTDAFEIDRKAKTVSIRNLKGTVDKLSYDKLILSPGASPLRPKVEGINHPRILTLRNLEDMDKIDVLMKGNSCKTVAVIGAGFIGLEMVEQLHRIHKTVHLIEKAPAVLPQADVEMAEFLHAPMIQNGIQMHLGDGLVSFTARSNGGIIVNLESGQKVSADVAVLCIGVKPENDLAKQANLNMNSRGYIAVNEYMQTNDPDVYAVGDVIETTDLVFPERKATVALGNIANMQARIAADHIVLGKSIPFKGALGTSIVRVFDMVLALAGWNEKRLKAANIPYKTTTVTYYAHASYYPGALPITLKVIFDPITGRIYGGQAIGIDGVDKRIDIIATAITGGLTIDDLSLTQLCYSPPFGSARDVVNIAGLAARNITEGLVHPIYTLPTTNTAATTATSNGSGNNNTVTLDVRPTPNAQMSPIPNSINIPFAEIANRISELDPTKEYLTVCALGKTAYFSSRQLINAGLKSSTLIGGLKIHGKPVATPMTPPANGHSSGTASTGATSTTGTSAGSMKTVVTLDCSGLACPGPLLKLKESIANLPVDSVLKVTATDPGFVNDVKAYANSNNLILTELSLVKGIVKASLTKQSASPSVGGANTTAVAVNDNKNNTALATTKVRKGATIVVFSQEFDKVLGALVIANGAAAMGGDVTMFFTFWGLNALRDSNKQAEKPKDFIDGMFGRMMPNGKDALPLSHMNYGGLGAMLMKHVMKEKHLPNLPDLLASAKAQNIRLVACTMSMEAMGIQASELVDGVELGGVADYLQNAENSGTNLFI